MEIATQSLVFVRAQWNNVRDSFFGKLKGFVNTSCNSYDFYVQCLGYPNSLYPLVALACSYWKQDFGSPPENEVRSWP